jgi:long-chain acyl-CoA synthetase
MNLRERFRVSLVERASQPALEWDGRVRTFGDIDASSNRMAHALAARGLGRGDRLCVYLPNSATFIDIFLACIIPASFSSR